jgi:hypothetical protein
VPYLRDDLAISAARPKAADEEEKKGFQTVRFRPKNAITTSTGELALCYNSGGDGHDDSLEFVSSVAQID